MNTPLSPSLHKGILITLMVVPALLLMGASLAQEEKPAEVKPPKAKEKFKNIKVLKDIPADQLIPIMRKWNESLGVKCDFCHVIEANHTGFEKDDKHAKVVARDMVRMTMDINKRHKSVEKKVSCFTCHHGHPEPEAGK